MKRKYTSTININSEIYVKFRSICKYDQNKIYEVAEKIILEYIKKNKEKCHVF